MRKEQVVLIGTVAILGYLGYRAVASGRWKRANAGRAEAPVLVHHVAPDTALVLPMARAQGDFARDLFSPPSDTRPLPPLEFESPPLVALPVLFPPPLPGPEPRLFGRLLRSEARRMSMPDLFAVEDAVDAPASASAPVAPSKGESLDAEQKAAQVAAYKKSFDWYRHGGFRWGQIRNKDRYRLAKRPNEALAFVEFDEVTGMERFPGQPPVDIARTMVDEFAFADTVANQIEIRRAEFSSPLTAADYDPALQLADWCIEMRYETPRALQVAEEMFTLATKVVNEDPVPKLGLARCFEVGFQFEKAFEVYRGLLAGNMARNPLVLARMAELEARFRMYATAEERLLEAERFGRHQWQVQMALGRFLVARGRANEAVPHLRLANESEPQGAEHKHTRAQLRCDLAAALVASGDLVEAKDWYEKALQADPAVSRGRSGMLALGVLNGAANASNTAVGEAMASADFESLVASGLQALRKGSPDGALVARRALQRAAALDPLRANVAWRALSFLAESTGNPEEALRYIEQALESDPTDAWTLYQHGRLLASRDDLDGAEAAFKAALDREIGFADALAALGDLFHRRGDFASAERYLERALSTDPSLGVALALRGVNFLHLGALRESEECFKKLLASVSDQPTARNGLAWCFYRRGDATEARTRFGELEDNRRSRSEDDPHKKYAHDQIVRITDHLEKVVWSDRFERSSILNGWQRQENNGPQLSIHDGIMTISGAFTTNGRARMWQEKPANDFVSIEARITIHAQTSARVGLFVSRETQRANDITVDAEVTVSRHMDAAKNTLQTRIIKRGQEDDPYTDVLGFYWKFDQPVLVRIERTGESSDTRVRILVDGIPVLENKPMPNLGRTNSGLRMGIFAEGQVGRQVQIDIDDVEIVYRGNRPR